MPCVRACALGGVPLRVPAAIDNVSQYFSQLGQATVLDLQELCMEVAERSLTEDEACETVRKGVVEAWKDGKVLALRLNATAPDLMLSWNKPNVLPSSSWAEACHTPGRLLRLPGHPCTKAFENALRMHDLPALNPPHRPRPLGCTGPIHKDAAAMLRPSDGPVASFKIQVGAPAPQKPLPVVTDLYPTSSAPHHLVLGSPCLSRHHLARFASPLSLSPGRSMAMPPHCRRDTTSASSAPLT